MLAGLPITNESLRELDYLDQREIICDAFETSWQTGLIPQVEEYAEACSPEFRQKICRELLLIQRECGEFFPHKTGALETERSLHGETVHQTSELRTTSGSPSRLLSHFDRFLILRELGSGSFGFVYEAEDVNTRRRVALKVPKPNTDATISGSWFTREAAAASRVAHASAVKVYEVNRYQGTPYMVSELVRGQPLAQCVDALCPDDKTVVRLFIELLRGVDAAHSASVVHRDLKPSNVMVEPLPSDHVPANAKFDPQLHHIRILDFGIAKAEDLSSIRTLDGEVLGTPHYMSPEQAGGKSMRDPICFPSAS